MMQETNRDGGVRGKQISLIARSCPEADASDLFLKLQSENVKYVFSICSQESFNIMREPIGLLDIVFFQAGRNYGNECAYNVIMLGTAGYQEITPSIIYLIKEYRMINVIFIFKADDYRASRISLIKSILPLTTFTNPEFFIILPNNTKDDNNAILRDAVNSLQQYPGKCLTIMLVDQEELEQYSEYYYNLFGSTPQQLANSLKTFPVVVMTDLSGTLNNPQYLEGYKVISSYAATIETDFIDDFIDAVGSHVDGFLIPYSIVQVYDAFQLLTYGIQKIEQTTENVEEIIDQIKEYVLTGVTGYSYIDENNHLLQQILFSTIKNGIVDDPVQISEIYPSHPFYNDYDYEKEIRCVGSQLIEIPSIVIAVFVSITESEIDKSLQMIEAAMTQFETTSLSYYGLNQVLLLCDIKGNLAVMGDYCFNFAMMKKAIAIVGTSSYIYIIF